MPFPQVLSVVTREFAPSPSLCPGFLAWRELLAFFQRDLLPSCATMQPLLSAIGNTNFKIRFPAPKPTHNIVLLHLMGLKHSGSLLVPSAYAFLHVFKPKLTQLQFLKIFKDALNLEHVSSLIEVSGIVLEYSCFLTAAFCPSHASPCYTPRQGLRILSNSQFCHRRNLPRRKKKKKVNRKWRNEAIFPNIREQVTNAAKYQ